MTNRMMSGVVAWLALVGTAAQAQVGNQSSHITSSTVTTVVSGNFLPYSVGKIAGKTTVVTERMAGYTVNPATPVVLPDESFTGYARMLSLEANATAERRAQVAKTNADRASYNSAISAMQGDPASIATVTTAITNAGVPAVTATSLVSILAMIGARPNTMGNMANAIVLYNAALKSLTAAQLTALAKTQEGKLITASVKRAHQQALKTMTRGAKKAASVYSR
jgi:hypothetical protein